MVDEVTLEPAAGPARRRPRALWAALAALAVVGGTLAVAAGRDDGGDPPVLPVSLGSAGGGAETAAAADSSIAAWVTYVAGDGVPALGGEATAYRLSGEVDDERLAALGTALGFEGGILATDGVDHGDEVVRFESDAGVLEVYPGAGVAWSYTSATQLGSGSSATASGGCEPGEAGSVDCTVSSEECAVAEDGGEVCRFTDAGRPIDTLECAAEGEPCVHPEPAPPAALPSEDEARAIALELLSATGIDVYDAAVTVDGPYDAWYVTVEPRLGGVPVAGWFSTVAVGSHGTITSASGTLAAPERLGDYPTLDTRAAIDRLNEQQAGLFDGAEPMPMPAPDVAVSGGATGSDEGCAADGPGCMTPGTSVVTADTIPCKPQPDGREICEDPGLVDPVAPTTTLAAPCEPQPDGREICEVLGTAPQSTQCIDEPVSDVASNTAVASCEVPECPQAAPAGPGTADAAPTCTPPRCPDTVVSAPADGGVVTETTIATRCEPVPLPEPQPIEVLLTGAERALVLLPAVDGSGDAYLVPGYRFSSDDGGTVDVPAVADESLAPTPSGVPEETEPPAPEPVATSGPAEPPVIRQPEEAPVTLEAGEEPQIGVGYRVELLLHCVVLIDWSGRWWDGEAINAPPGWTGSGTFTLTSPDEGTYIDDGAPSEPATFHSRGPAEQYPGCD